MKIQLLLPLWTTIFAFVISWSSFTTSAVAEKPDDFAAVGELLCGMSATKASELCVMSPEFYNTQIEILRGDELRLRTLERLRSKNPELKEIEVEIRVVRIKDTSIIDLVATGSDSKYIRIYLGSLLDEYMLFQIEMTDKSIGIAMNRIIEEVLAREKDLKVKRDALVKAREKKSNTPVEALAAMEFEFTETKEDYQGWANALNRLDASAVTAKSPIVIMQHARSITPLNR